MTTQLILARHGKTNLNAKDKSGDSAERIRGWVDVPLDPKGVSEGDDLAEYLKNRDIQRVYSSPLQRAMHTAQKIAKEHDLSVIKLASLKPWNLGEFQGKSVTDVLPEMKKLQSDFPNKPAPSGESWNTFLKRYISRLRDLMHQVEGGKTVVATTHFRNLATAMAWLETGTDNDRIDLKTLDRAAKELDTGDIFCMEWNGKDWSGKIENV